MRRLDAIAMEVPGSDHGAPRLLRKGSDPRDAGCFSGAAGSMGGIQVAMYEHGVEGHAASISHYNEVVQLRQGVAGSSQCHAFLPKR